MNRTVSIDSILACCHGFTVKTTDREIGTVVTPIFSGTRLQPDSLLVHLTGSPPSEAKTIAIALITDIDPERHQITLDTDAHEALDESAARQPTPTSPKAAIKETPCASR